MKEIDAEIAAIDQQIAALQADRAALLRANAIIQKRKSPEPLTIAKSTTMETPLPRFSSPLSITSASEQILKDGPMHVNAILAAILEMGKKTSKQSIVSALIRNKDRFENLGRNTFKLREQESANKTRETRKAAKLTRAGVIAGVLREHGGRMRAGELMRILAERGDPVTQPVLANAVMRKIGVLFTRPEPGVYALIEEGREQI